MVAPHIGCSYCQPLIEHGKPFAGLQAVTHKSLHALAMAGGDCDVSVNVYFLDKYWELYPYVTSLGQLSNGLIYFFAAKIRKM